MRSRVIVITRRLVISATKSEFSRFMIDDGRMSRQARSFRKSMFLLLPESSSPSSSGSDDREYRDVVHVDIDLAFI